MKNSRIVISIFLVALVAVGWVLQIIGIADRGSTYDASLAQAALYQEKGLYQKSIMEYENALALRESMEVRTMWLTAYDQAYLDGVVEASDYSDAMLAACQIYPDQVHFWEALLAFYLENGEYNSAYSAYKQCIKADAHSEKLAKLCNDVLYSFTPSRKIYLGFTRSPLGYYSVCDEFGWGAIDPSGERTASCDYQYVGPFNQNNQALYISEKDARLIGEDGIVEAIVLKDIVLTGAQGDGLVPVLLENSYWYYMDCDTGILGQTQYSDASNYLDGYAMVCNNGTWVLLNSNGEQSGGQTFEDVKLHGNKDYQYKDIMIAAKAGLYGIYDKKGEAKNNFTCKDADVYLGGYIAYQDASGKWGYVNKDGEIVIEPKFDNAKSFSNELAAVQNGSMWGYINQKGDVVIDYQYLDADYFTKSGVSFVSTIEGEYYLIKLRFAN